MAKGKKARKARKGGAKSRGKSALPGNAKGVQLSGQQFDCYAKQVRTGKGSKKSTRGFCRKRKAA